MSYLLPAGEWTPQASSELERALGLMVLDGLVLRRVSAGHLGVGIELLGPHDLLRPWQQDSASFAHSAWDVIETTRVAVLDERATGLMSQWPPLVANIVALALARSRSLALQAAIMNARGVEARVHLLLWALAEKWGTVSTDGVAFGLQVPQRVLAQMIGCRRPTMSTAIQSLREKGLIDSTPDGRWILLDHPPEPSAASA
jgi:CRP/FNR family cyclic AMP-dependent transcriptional regulator